MKNYKKVQVLAKNAPSGSYAAGCPAEGTGYGYGTNILSILHKCRRVGGCSECERSR